MKFLPRSLPLRWHLVLLVVGTLLPLVLFSSLVVARLAQEQRAAALRRLSYSSRLMGETVERELTSTTRTLEALAGSDRLEREDLRGFWLEARRAIRTQPTWKAIQLVTPDGRQWLSTSRDFGTPLPPVADWDSLRRLVKSGKPAVGNLVRSPIGGQWMFPVRVPVYRAGKLRFVLTASITPTALTQTVTRQLPPGEEWTRTVLDAHHVIVARTRDPERFIGHPATHGLLQQIRAAEEGIYRNRAIDGMQVYAAYSRTREARWTTVVTAAQSAIDGQVTSSLAAVAGSGAALLLLSGLGAYGFSRRVSRGIHSAAKAASALAHGSQPQMPTSAISELATLSMALDLSSQLLAQRAAERDELLVRADAARAQAEAANRAKDEFLAMLGHELRNPLAPIITALHVLRLRGKNDTREWEIIDRQAKHLSNLVDDLLDVSRITRGTVDLGRELVEVSTLFTRSVEMVLPLYQERQHELRETLPETELWLEGDERRLIQIISNLLTNAAKYTPPGGQVLLIARQEGDQVELTVRDNGQGMTPELLARVFDPFQQGPRTRDRPEGGLGVGLAIVQNLVRLHGGTVTAASNGPGKGSTFTVRLLSHRPVDA